MTSAGTRTPTESCIHPNPLPMFPSLYFMDGFQGIGNVPKENITCNFTKNSVLLEIRNFKGKNYRYFLSMQLDLSFDWWFLENTEHSIKPDKSSMKVGKNRISIYLVKEQSENWVSLVASNFSAPVPVCCLVACLLF